MTMKHSALFHLHARSGATFAEHHGWEMPGSFTAPEAEASALRTGVGLADISYRTKFESKAQPQRFWWRLASNHYLTIGEPPLEAPAGATDVTCVYANLLLAGPHSRDVLAKLTSLNCERLPNQSCGQASVAHTHAVVLREDLGSLPAFHLLVSREYSESVWESILHAGYEFHLHPFGLRAFELLRT
jgi:glycine cleavage system aminomethyltransferase T